MNAIERKAPPMTFACANPHSLVEAQKRVDFQEVLNRTTVVVADGVGVTAVARLLGLNVGPRITGHDYFAAVMSALNQRGHGRAFFVGSTDRVLARIRARIAIDYPRVVVCGAISPPFRNFTEQDNQQLVTAINAAQPDVLWVGMTAPKQELWVDQRRDDLSVPVIGSIGAVFEFCAGTVRRAPRVLRSLGLEWAYRLLREPKRLWRRTIVSAPAFLIAALRQHGNS